MQFNVTNIIAEKEETFKDQTHFYIYLNFYMSLLAIARPRHKEKTRNPHHFNFPLSEINATIKMFISSKKKVWHSVATVAGGCRHKHFNKLDHLV